MRLPPSLEIRSGLKDGKGRGLFVTCDTKQGARLASFEPHAIALASARLIDHCSYCSRQASLNDETGVRLELLRCSACKVARFCDAECQRKAWKPGEHKEECRALQRIKESGATSDDPAFGSCAVPDTPVRALARLLWRRPLQLDNWWTDIVSLQSHREDLTDEGKRDMGMLAQRLAAFVGPEVIRTLSNAVALLDLCSSFASNSFALTSFDLSNIVVVFPDARRSPLHLVAVRDIPAGQEIVTSYVDLSLPRRLRQKDLKTRYFFDCRCGTCTVRTDRVDPRKAVKCRQEGCERVSNVPPLCSGEAVAVRCANGHETVLPPSLVDAIGELDVDALGTLSTAELNAKRRLLEQHLPDTSSPLFAILRTLQERALADASSSSIPLASRVAGAMQQLYDRGHPVRGVQLAALGKLMLNSEQGPTREAVFVLRKALEEIEIGFGGTGAALVQVRGMLRDCEAYARARSDVHDE